MFSYKRIYSSLDRIEKAIRLILANTESVNSADDFLMSQDGMFTLSGVCMQLIFIGENVKVIDLKAGNSYLKSYPNVPWTEIMGLRDIIAHEYHRIDAEEIYLVIKNDIPTLLNVIQQMKKDLESNL